MGRNRKFSKEDFEKALEGCRGVQTWVARRLQISRTTVMRYLTRYPDLKEKFDAAREAYLDELEQTAAKIAIDDKNPVMVIFLLKTLGKERGYVEKMALDAKVEAGYCVLRAEEEAALFGEEICEEG